MNHRLLYMLNIFLISLSIALYSCSDKGSFNFNDNLFEDDNLIIQDEINLDEEVTFIQIKAAIIDTQCLGCHNSERARGGVDLSSYQSTIEGKTENGKIIAKGDSEDSLFYTEVFNAQMPPRKPLNEEEIALVKKWIDTGAKEGSEIPSDSADNEINFSKLDVDYINLKEYILKDKCLNCHNTQRAKAEVDLSTYDSMFGFSEYFSTITTPGMPNQSALYTEVFSGNMPPKTKLSLEEIDYIRRWIEEGAVYEIQKELPLSQTSATYTNLRERILENKCLRCHNPEKARADVDLSSYAKVFDYSEYFSVITEAGNPEASGIYTEVFSGNMPPKVPLEAEEVAFIKRWILEGALE